MARLSNKFNPLLKTYPESRKINSVSEGAEVLYVRLLAASDDAGRYYGDAGWVLSKLFTARALAGQLDKSTVESRLCELESCGLIARYHVGSETFLELIGVMKSLRSDVTPQLLFPERLTESGTERPALDPPTSTSTQPNNNPTSTTTSTTTSTATADVDGTDVDVDGSFGSSKEGTSPPHPMAASANWESFDWSELVDECQQMAAKFPKHCLPLRPEDREEIVKVQALLKVGWIEREWVTEALAKARRRSTKKPFAAFHGTLAHACKLSGRNLNQMYRQIGDVPTKIKQTEYAE